MSVPAEQPKRWQAAATRNRATVYAASVDSAMSRPSRRETGPMCFRRARRVGLELNELT